MGSQDSYKIQYGEQYRSVHRKIISYTADSVLSGLCVKRTSVLSGQIFWSRQDVPLFQYKTLCVKRTSVLCGQRTDFLKIWSRASVLRGHISVEMPLR